MQQHLRCVCVQLYQLAGNRLEVSSCWLLLPLQAAARLRTATAGCRAWRPCRRSWQVVFVLVVGHHVGLFVVLVDAAALVACLAAGHLQLHRGVSCLIHRDALPWQAPVNGGYSPCSCSDQLRCLDFALSTHAAPDLQYNVWPSVLCTACIDRPLIMKLLLCLQCVQSTRDVHKQA